MKKIYFSLFFSILLGTSLSQSALAQNALNPDDPIVNYDSLNPPQTPPTGVVGKWVRTPTLNWNTSAWKAYYYNGIAFRLLFPKSYSANPNKKYPLLVFFHGAGEVGDIYNNELQLANCARKIQDSVLNGTFDAFVLFPQSQSSSWFAGQMATVANLINYLTINARVDSNRIIAAGLSGGGEATWNFSSTYPKLVAAATPISASTAAQADPTFINSIVDIPIWLSQGGIDDHPVQGMSDHVIEQMTSAGMDIRTVNPTEEGVGPQSEGFYIVYPNLGHNTWDAFFKEPMVFQYMLRAYKSNPHVVNGRREFCPGTPINVKLQLTPGFNGYEWSRNGVMIAGANTNTLTVTDTGTYYARIKNGTNWSDWSHWPAQITYKGTTQTPPIQVSGLMSSVIPAPDGNTSVKLTEPAGYASYQWKNSANQVVGTSQEFTATQPGNYTATVTEIYGCSAVPSQPFYVASNSGPNPPDPATHLSGFALSQTSIQLNWSNNLTPNHNESAFEIYRGTNSGGPYQLVGINPADSLGFIDNNLSANTEYFYIIRSIDSTSSAAPSGEDSIVTLVDSQAPSAPGNLTVIGTTANSVSLRWNASIDNASVKNYGIYINGAKSYLSTDTVFTVYNLTHGKTYVFTVKAADPTGNISVASNQVIASAAYTGLTYKYYTYTGSWSSMQDLSTLSPVSTGTSPNISLSPATQSTNFAFSWTGFINIRQAGTYKFFTNSDDGSKLLINNSLVVNNDGLHAASEKSGNYTFAQPGVFPFEVDFYQEGGGSALTVSWQASSLNIPKSSIPDSAFSETIASTGNSPAIPTTVTATALSYDSVRITWADNSNNESGFEIYRSDSSSGIFQIINTAKPNTTSFADTTVSPSTTYYYKVQAINQYGSSGFDLASMGGINYSYYESNNFSTMPDFNSLIPVANGNVPNVTLSIKKKSSNYALKFFGTINIPTAGAYTFYTKSDDGSNLYIDGFDAAHQIVNNNYLQGPTERSGTISNLSAGLHSIYITFFQQAGGDYLDASYSGPGINKQNIPDVAFNNGHNKATTPALPPTPAMPGNISAYATSANSITVNWSDNSNDETSFNIYRSDGNNSIYRPLKNLPAGSTSYADSGLYANTIYYYKIEALNAGGTSGLTNEASSTTFDHLPKLSKIADQSIRYGTVAQIDLISTDEDNEHLTLSAQNYPQFTQLNDYGDGTGLLTFNPTSTQQGTYSGIKILVSDQHGGRDSVIFNLTVNDNYPPVISTIQPIQVNAPASITDTIYSVDQNIGDSAKWTINALPSFVTAHPTADGRNLILNINPSLQDTGSYNFQVAVSDSSAGLDEEIVNLTVTSQPTKKWYLNFSYQTTAGSPWNNITGVTTTALKDADGATSNVGLKLQTTWWNGYNSGAVTGNNSGIYPDNVIRDYYYFGIFNGPNTVTGSVTGLDINQTYSLTFFSSSIWTNVSDNGYTVFQIGGKKDSIYAQANTNRTLTFSHLQPAADGTISFIMSKGLNTSAGYLNAMVISTEMQMPPAKPTNIQLSSTGNQIKVAWHLSTSNADRINIYRSTKKDSTYTLLNPGANNGSDSLYLDNSILPNTRYYYYLVSMNAYGVSMPSDTANISTAETTQFIDTRKWYLNFKYQTSANSPWNNITSVTTTGIKDDRGQSSNVGLKLQTTWWSGYNSGAVTGNNSGIYPDNVIKDYYYFGIFNGPNSVTGSVTGLDINQTYSLTFFSSSVWANVADNGYTVFQIGSQRDSIYVQANTNRTSTFSHLHPAADGTISFTMSKGPNTSAGYLNAMTVTTENSEPPLKPINMSLSNVIGTGGNEVNVAWQLGSTNTTSTNVYRSTKKDSTYTLLNPGAVNGDQLSYADANTLSSTKYYYYLVAGNANGNSGSTDTLSITTPSAPATPPNISPIANVYIQGATDSTISVNATAGGSDLISFSIQNAPSFVSLQNGSNGTAKLILNPSLTDIGLYDSIKVTATTENGRPAYKYFSIYVTDGGLTSSISLNFTDVAHTYALPWNNLGYSNVANKQFTNLLNGFGKQTGVSATIVNTWTGTANYGENTYNNSGAVPDGVMSSYYYFQDNTIRTIKIGGLDPNKKYNIVAFGSSMYGTTTNYSTNYSIGDQSIVINNLRNTSHKARFNGLSSDQNGNLTLTVSKATGADYGIINSMVIEEYVNGTIVAPGELKALPNNGKITLNWEDRSNNETSFEIWKSSSLDGPYSKIDQVPAESTSYTDNAVSPNTRYFYKILAKMNAASSAYSNTADATTPQFEVYVNFNQKEANAPAPWNNTDRGPTFGDIYGPFNNSQGENTNMIIQMDKNFEGENNVGVVTGDNSGIYPDIVMNGLYYQDKSVVDTIVMHLSNLNLAMQYDLTFFGSLTQYGGWDNTSLFIVNGKTAALTTTYNTTETTSLNNIYPDQNGQITIVITCTPTSSYAILGAMVIKAHSAYDDNGNPVYNPNTYMFNRTGSMLSLMPSKMDPGQLQFRILKTYPNPFSQYVDISLSTKSNDKLIISLVDSKGSVQDIQSKSVSGGLNTIRYESAPNLSPGFYLLNIYSTISQKSISIKLIKQ